MQYQITSYELLKQMLASVADDNPLYSWNAYPCLLWPRGLHEKRRGKEYGKVKVSGHDERVHVVAFKLVVGPIPEGCEVCHHCDVTSCFRPIHLFAATHRDNALDCVAKNRLNHTTLTGTDCPWATLTDQQVIEMRKLRLEQWTTYALAERFSVSASLVSMIVNYKRWKHI